jgi:hypothetical protein
MGLIDLVVTVCALSLPGQCEEQHLSFSADAVRWRCDYGGSKEKS